jgi:hypothetical protein
VKSLTEFAQKLLKDLGSWCRTSTTADFKTVCSRFEHEGLSFLTITLASFGKDFQKSLDQGFVADEQFPGFARTAGLPRFLSGFLQQVFDRETGRLLDVPSVTAIWAIRQFTLMWAKINLECSPARQDAAIRRYIECEKEVREADAKISAECTDRFNRISTLLWGDLLSYVDRNVYEGEIIPQHGPGATADRLVGNDKWLQQEWPERLEREFSSTEYLIPNWRYLQDIAGVSYLEPGTERPVRVIRVPKTLSTPRIIAIEPAAMQYMQQGLLGAFEQAFERFDLPRKLVGWKSQVPNQHLALVGSRDGAFATLDLSEASDRVSNQHVRGLLRNHPHLNRAVDSCRSRKADVPGYGVIRLAKFASMGSALCFPMEAMVFATVVFCGIERELSRPLTRRDIQSLAGKVRVYGDDIIVPVEFVHRVTAELETFGFRVNADKSFWTGKFRESCGKDYYDGVDVSIVRLRSLFPASRADVPEIVSTLSTRNLLYKAGLWRSAAYLDDLVGGLIPLPRVSETSPMLGRHSFLGPDLSGRLCPDTHVPLVKGYSVKSRIPVSKLEDYAALLKSLILLERKFESTVWNLPDSKIEHLERSGRPVAVDIKPGWGPSY